MDALQARGDAFGLTRSVGDDDALREAERSWTTRVLTERLAATGHRWRCVRGGREARLDTALAAVDELLAAGWRLAPPLG